MKVLAPTTRLLPLWPIFADVKSDVEDLTEVVDVIDEDLGEVEKDLYETEDDDDDDCCCDDDDEEDYDDIYDDEDDDEELFDDDDLYEVICPTCGDTICLNSAMIEDGSINCPNCNELLEFDLDDIEDEEEPEETEE